jgi:hypothetical protein
MTKKKGFGMVVKKGIPSRLDISKTKSADFGGTLGRNLLGTYIFLNRRR